MNGLDDRQRDALAQWLAAAHDLAPSPSELVDELERNPVLRRALIEQLETDRLLRRRGPLGATDLAPRVLAELRARREQQVTERAMAEVRRVARPEPRLAPHPSRALAIVSDIHANLEALQVVLADIARRGIHDVLCLGDIIGYGPNPRECIREVGKVARLSLLGNHEEAVLFHAEDFNAKARRAIDWTRAQLNASTNREEDEALWDYIGDLRKDLREGEVLYVHGSPRQPTREYVLPSDAKDSEKMGDIFEQISSVCFAGHTHIPGVFLEGSTAFRYARELENTWRLVPGQKVLVNVGSVGQPRDSDNRACYVTVEDGVVSWHRLDYDFRTTMAKLAATPALANYLAERLRDGR